MSIEILIKFKKYHRENPQIWLAFERLALRAASSKQKFGSKAIFEVMRWETMISGKGEFKICNDYTPYYARLFEEVHPAYANFFRKKNILPEGISVSEYINFDELADQSDPNNVWV